jgi:hypothetical protein
MVLRHDAVRDIVLDFARRGQLQPVLEKCGILDEPGVLVSLRRPADVLVDSLSRGAVQQQQQRPEEAPKKVALDIKVINALGQGHYEQTLSGPHVAAVAYRLQQQQHQDTGAHCAAAGICYEPLVFTAQGACEPHAEAILNKIVQAVADSEAAPKAQVKSELMEKISLSIARSVARAVARRAPPKALGPPGTVFRILAECGGALEP